MGAPDPRHDEATTEEIDDQESDEQISPIEGLMNPEEGVNSPTSDADAPASFG